MKVRSILGKRRQGAAKAMRGRIALPEHCVPNSPRTPILFGGSFRSVDASPRRFWYGRAARQPTCGCDVLYHSSVPSSQPEPIALQERAK
jgi:hypothetical protein